jgi:hypothetical protein
VHFPGPGYLVNIGGSLGVEDPQIQGNIVVFFESDCPCALGVHTGASETIQHPLLPDVGRPLAPNSKY